MRLARALLALWHSWRCARHALAYRRHLERTLDLRGGRRT